MTCRHPPGVSAHAGSSAPASGHSAGAAVVVEGGTVAAGAVEAVVVDGVAGVGVGVRSGPAAAISVTAATVSDNATVEIQGWVLNTRRRGCDDMARS